MNQKIHSLITSGTELRTKKWQAVEVEEVMVEKLFVNFTCEIPKKPDLVEATGCDQEWADLHFKERIQGYPTNPDISYKKWPYYREGEWNNKGKFSHTYTERIWSKNTEFGDLNSVISQLNKDGTTRQAYIPIFWPIDTGNVNNWRVPCTLGWHFIIRGGYLHVNYMIRSCDALRHYRNDIYLTCLLAHHIANKTNTTVGLLHFNCTNLHCFKSDLYTLIKKLKSCAGY